jgi:hypothetical protein
VRLPSSSCGHLSFSSETGGDIRISISGTALVRSSSV